ncbi:16036_t:CDS:2 [Acaulospora colombiana]|uniref:16036_t:CDS:1 n=1 Tax=Acaulospora colombiana TaxID=27376 RepID=A0ACA9L4P7_9GLOM|nr:16036_t:CDS:2 [Acaulospora colombiana]
MTFFASIDIPSLLILILIAYVSHYYYKYFTRESPLPGPIPLPLVGNIFTIFGDISIWPLELQAKYGDMFEIYMGSKRKIWLCNEELTQKIFSPTINGNFHNRLNEDSDLREIGVLNTGLAFNIDYEHWAYIRKFYSKAIFSPAFMRQALTSTQTSFQKMEDYWMKLEEGTVLDFSEWMRSLFSEITFLLTTRKSLHTLTNYYNKISHNKDKEVSDIVLKENEYVSKCASEFASAVVWFLIIPRIVRNLPGISQRTKKYKEQVKWLRSNLLKIVKARREEIERTPESEQLTPDLLTMFLTVNTSRDFTKGIADDINSRPMTDEEIAPIFMEISSAGTTSLTNSICYLFYTISKYPNVKQRIIEELDVVFGKDPNSQITYEGINKLYYCDAVYKEVGRISSITPFINKKNKVPEQIGDYVFPENTEFFINFRAIRKNKSNWKDPELFNPDRFMDESHPDYKKDVYIFGGGVRKCPGRNLAKLQLKATLALFFRKYDIELVNKEAPLKFSKSLLKQCIGFEVKIKKRDY